MKSQGMMEYVKNIKITLNAAHNYKVEDFNKDFDLGDIYYQLINKEVPLINIYYLKWTEYGLQIPYKAIGKSEIALVEYEFSKEEE